MKTKTIVFDLDDTLIEEIEYLKSAFKGIAHFLDSHNTLLFDEMLSWYEKKEDVFERLINRYSGVTKSVLRDMYRNHVPSFNSQSGKSDLLQLLKNKGYVLGLITDGYSVTQRNKIKALDIENLFDLIIVSEEFGSEKPNPKNYEIFHQFNTVEYFYIGDNVKKDFITPNQLGWKTICLLDGGNNIHQQDFDIGLDYRPMIKIRTLNELLNFI